MKSFHRRVVYRLALLFAFVAFLAVPALAQVTTADITGRVLDQLGAAVPNANVTIRSLGTGQTRTATTNEEGDYTITHCPPEL